MSLFEPNKQPGTSRSADDGATSNVGAVTAAQVLQPDWSSCFCYDVKASAATRWRFFREHVNTDTLVIPTHFPGTTAGRIAPLGEAFEFKFLAP